MAVGSLYLFVTCTVPLYHTCGLGGRQSGHCDGLVCSLRTQTDISATQIGSSAGLRPHSGSCPACIFAATSNSTQPRPAAVTTGGEVFSGLLLLPRTTAVKQLEWLSSVSLRAPPGSIS